MKWFKVPSNLSLKADWKDRFVIIEYGCLYAQLEREPTEKELSKQLTRKQRERLAEWLPTLREQLAKDLAETKTNRKSRNINYEKSAELNNKTTPYITPNTTPNNTETIQPQIRRDKIRKEKESTPKPPLNKFSPPTLQEVLTYAKQQNELAGCGGFACSKATAEEFWGNYEATGWIVGNESRTPIRDWQAKLRQWAARNRNKTPPDDIPTAPKEVPTC